MNWSLILIKNTFKINLSRFSTTLSKFQTIFKIQNSKKYVRPPILKHVSHYPTTNGTVPKLVSLPVCSRQPTELSMPRKQKSIPSRNEIKFWKFCRKPNGHDRSKWTSWTPPNQIATLGLEASSCCYASDATTTDQRLPICSLRLSPKNWVQRKRDKHF